jgi:amino acid transporter
MPVPTRTLPLAEQLRRRKPIVFRDHHHEGEELKRGITTFQLTMFGVGATVGTGIFFVLSESVPEAGPAVIISFLIAGLAAGLSALCYAELASAIPVSGSTYSYAYHAMG